MAQVVDVITEININANTNPVEQLNKAVGETQTKIQSLITLNETLMAREKQMAQQGITDRRAINAQIDLNRQKVEALTASLGKQLVTNEKLQQTVKRTKQQFDSLGFSIGNLIRDAPYGFIGIANNIGPAFDDLFRKLKQLQAEGKPTSAIFSSIGASLFGFTGLINLAVVALQLFGDKLFRSADAAKSAKDEYTKFIEALGSNSQQALRATDEQITKLSILQATIAKGGQVGAAAIKQLRSQYPDLTKNITDAAFAQGKANKVFDEIKNQIAAKERSNALTKDAAEVAQQERLAQQGRNEIQKRLNASLAEEAKYRKEVAEARARQRPGDERVGIAAISQLNQQINTTRRLRGELQAADDVINNLAITRERLQSTAVSQGVSAAGILFPGDKEREKTGKSLEDIRQRIDELARAINRLDSSELFKFGEELERIAEEANKELDLLFKNFVKLEQGLFGSQLSTSDALNLEIQLAEFTPEAKEKRQKEQKKQAEERKDNIQAAVEGYQTLATAVGDVFDQIYDKQLAALDRQISATQERISLAVGLAKQGNAEILQEETNRLDELNKKREEIAEKQLRTNALLRASSAAIATAQAIQVVTNAGATGDPYTTAARIAAAVAALAAGISFATSLTEAFAEGVVDYQGKGTAKSDSNLVRISRGESVITAEATQRFKPFLEAMNSGTFNPYTAMPVMNGGVSRVELDGVNARLDQLIEAFHSTGTTVHANVNEHGLYLATETSRRRNQSRWR